MVLILISLWRILLFGIAAVGSRLIPFTPQFPYSDIYLLPSHLPQWMWAWANFDGVHYLTIAKQGYFAQFTQAFFPVYPLLMRFVSWLFHDNRLIPSGLLISFFSLFGSVYILRSLLVIDFKTINSVIKNRIISKTLLFLLIFPTSFYFGAVYTESLFLFLVLLAFYFSRKKRWLISGLISSIASATRISGIFLIPALLWEYHQQFRVQYSKLKVKKKLLLFTKKTFSSQLIYLAPLGLMSYMFYLWKAFDDPIYFWHAQPVFGAERSGGSLIFPLQVVWRYAKILISVEFASPSYLIALWELASVIVAVGLLFVAHKKKIRFSYLLFSWLIVVTPMLTGTFSSMPRYILLAFPMYQVLGSANSRILQLLSAVISVGLLIFFTLNFLGGRWVS